MLFLNWDEYLCWSERDKDEYLQVLAEPRGKKDDNVCDITNKCVNSKQWTSWWILKKLTE